MLQLYDVFLHNMQMVLLLTLVKKSMVVPVKALGHVQAQQAEGEESRGETRVTTDKDINKINNQMSFRNLKIARWNVCLGLANKKDTVYL